MSDGQIYPSDLTDREWTIIKPLFPPAASRGRPRKWPRRLILNGIFYVIRSGCAWRMLPRDFPPWQTVYCYFRKWRQRALWYLIHTRIRKKVRTRSGRNPNASAAIIDSQSVKTTEAGGPRGFDNHKKTNGRKRHLLVDTCGLVIRAFVSPANLADQKGARWLLAGTKLLLPRLELIWADGAYGGEPLAEWCKKEGGWTLEIVSKDPDVKGFNPLPKRWIVERTFAWIGRYRRFSKDYERKVQTSEAMIFICMIRLMLKRLAHS